MRGIWPRAVSFALVLAMGGTGIQAWAQNADNQDQQSGSTAAAAVPAELPDSPGALVAQSSPAPQTSPSSASSTQQQPSEPSGTAVAPQPQVSGGAASKPAGAAIAPPKQRRTRSLLIKLGFIAGAGAALGTVVALSAASPGRVPGSH